MGELHLHHRRGVIAGCQSACAPALVIGALWLFVIALQLIKIGAGGLKPVLDSVRRRRRRWATSASAGSARTS